MTEVTEKMIEAGCRERCRQEGLFSYRMVHYVGNDENRYSCDPSHQSQSMPLWKWRFYESVKAELEAALSAREQVDAAQLLRELRQQARDWDGEPGDLDACMTDAHDTIKKLIDALTPFAQKFLTPDEGDINYARSVLTSMGLSSAWE